MNKKQTKEFEDWVNKELAVIQDLLLLQAHKLMPVKPSKDNTKCIYRYPYKEIFIEYSQSFMNDWFEGERDYLRQVLIHEMYHAVTDAFYSKAVSRYIAQPDLEDEREALVEHLSNITYNLLTNRK
tara:strand:+ start:4309 stop:4686 length:378 start_codon:yes stop_codon:yes gene_type:complete